MVTQHKRENESPEARERRLARQRAYQRSHYDPVKNAAYWHMYYERLKNGEITLPPLDWAICARGGSEAQARAHYRRGERPCEACRIACREARRKREESKKERMAS